MSLLARIRRGTYVPDDAPPLVPPGRRLTVADTRAHIAAGKDVLTAVRELLDQIGRADAGQITEMIAERPEPTGDLRADAMLAAIAEYASTSARVPCPRWTSEPGRFLERFWFVSPEEGFRAIAIAQSPISLKRHGILWPARSLRRV